MISDWSVLEGVNDKQHGCGKEIGCFFLKREKKKVGKRKVRLLCEMRIHTALSVRGEEKKGGASCEDIQ